MIANVDLIEMVDILANNRGFFLDVFNGLRRNINLNNGGFAADGAGASIVSSGFLDLRISKTP